MKRFCFIFLILQLSQSLLATEQIRDSLVYNGKGYLIENQFLFEEKLTQFIDENGFYDFNYPTSSLQRGYRAVFEIVENKIQLKDVGVIEFYKHTDETGFSFTDYRFISVVNDEILKEINSKLFSGLLILADGYLYNEYRFIEEEEYYPNYKILEFKKSIVSKELDFKYEELDGFKNIQFEKYKSTKFYRKDFRNCRKRKKELIKHFIKTNQLEMVKYEKQSNCNRFIKAFLFENPHYQTIL